MNKNKGIALQLLLVFFLLVVGLMCLWGAQFTHSIIPLFDSQYPWTAAEGSDQHEGGQSEIVVYDKLDGLSYDFTLKDFVEYPYASMVLFFDGSVDQTRFVDWSAYSSATLKVKCTPSNMLLLVVSIYDKTITGQKGGGDFLNYRPLTHSFACNAEWHSIRINLEELLTPEWWLLKHGLEKTASHNGYSLNNVYALTIVSSERSPKGVVANVNVSELVVKGTNIYLLFAAGFLFILVIAAVVWVFVGFNAKKRLMLPEPKTQVEPDSEMLPEVKTPELVYEQVLVETKKDREKTAVLGYLAKEFVNPELNQDTVVSTLGINRAKINDILRECQGLTFSTYLNKLRLTEAARLLREKEASVAEIGFAVGYRNASYFNRTFKKEYGCTPNAYRKLVDVACSANDCVSVPNSGTKPDSDAHSLSLKRGKL